MSWNAKSLAKPRSQTPAGRGVHLGHLALLYLAFAVLCFFTSLFFAQGSERRQVRLNTPGDQLIPLEVKKDNSVYEVTVSAPRLPVNSWAFLEGQVLDADKEYLFSFGDELSYYAGRDSEGPWTELKDSYATKLTIPKAGSYYLKFIDETSRRGDSVYASVTVSKLRGSSLPYTLAGVVAFIIAVVLNEIENRTITRVIKALDEMSDD